MLRIKYERLRRDWSQAALAAAADLHQPTIALIERERLVPSPRQLDRLSLALGVPPSELLLPIERPVESPVARTGVTR